MIWTNTKRIIRGGFINFWRNGFVSFACIVVITMCLVAFASLIFFNILTHAYLAEMKQKVDVNVYFTLNAKEADIQALQTSLSALPEVASIDYVSRDEAIERFRERHAGDARILQGLDELGSNPLPASLNIKAKEPSQYGSIAKFLESKNALTASGATIVDSINYHKNKSIIDKLTRIIQTSEKLGFTISIVLALVSIIVTFNTVRLAIYSSREEISVMRLVGAGSMYVRGPFVISGILYGFISSIVTLLLFYPLTYYLSNFASQIFGGVNLLNYYVSNFGQIFLIIVGAGIVLGALSSFMAVKRYLNI